ncbi:MAG: 4-hydroxybenzoate octaprenyltransferase [Gammaproteobacteria bacterium]|nr:MAG: 4-hydroxybenzoate octaprenyltransferase [Gammaproteobacteria bacterium]
MSFSISRQQRQFFLSVMQLMRVDRPVGTVLLACPMLWALWLASNGQPSASLVFIFLLGAFLMRSAGCVINDFADRKIDVKVKRTKDRPLTSGKTSSKAALGVFAVLVLLALSLLLFLPATALLPAVIAFVLATFYPFTKRFFVIPQLVLGLAYGMGIIMAYRVVNGDLPTVAWVLFWASTLWTIVYDTFYAMVDRDDDKSLGIHSSALWFAERDLLVCALCAIFFVVLMLTAGIIAHLGVFYYLGLLLAGACFAYQFQICRERQRQACFTAFLNNQWVGVLIFLGVLLDMLPH